MGRLRTFKRGSISVLAVDDPLMDDAATSLRETAEALLAEGSLQLVVDLGSVPFIDSSGLETLLNLDARIREAGGAFSLASPNALCRDILKATRLDKALLIHTTLDEASRSFL